MADTRPESFLSRWSRRKLAAAREAAPSARAPDAAGPASAAPVVTAADAVPAPGNARPDPAPTAEAALPPVESLTFDSDFTAFMQSGVDPGVRQAALRKLLHDPRFNVMDGLDVYIDDYTKPSPLPSGLARKLAHARYLFAPPPTRLNAEGHVEDIPEDEAAPADDASVEAARADVADADASRAASEAAGLPVAEAARLPVADAAALPVADAVRLPVAEAVALPCAAALATLAPATPTSTATARARDTTAPRDDSPSTPDTAEA